MTSEKTLSLMYEIVNQHAIAMEVPDVANFVITKPEEAANAVFLDTIFTNCAQIILDARREMDKAKYGGIIPALKRIVKEVEKRNTAAAGYWLNKDDKCCFCDGYRAVRLNNNGGFDAFKKVQGFDLDKAMAHCSDLQPELTLPSAGELKNIITAQKSRCSGRKRSEFRCFYYFDEHSYVNAEYLLDMLSILKDCKAYQQHPNMENRDIYFVGSNGDGLLLPVRPMEGENETYNFVRALCMKEAA